MMDEFYIILQVCFDRVICTRCIFLWRKTRKCRKIIIQMRSSRISHVYGRVIHATYAFIPSLSHTTLGSKVFVLVLNAN